MGLSSLLLDSPFFYIYFYTREFCCLDIFSIFVQFYAYIITKTVYYATGTD